MKENKHESWELEQMQNLPLKLKIKKTQLRIKEWYEEYDGKVYVSFSGGKDSTVLKHIVDSIYSDVPAVFINTGLEYPEIQQFVKRIKTGNYDCFNNDVEILRPEMRFDEVIKKYGYPVVSKETSKRIYELRNCNLSEKYRNRLLYSPDSRQRIAEKWKCLIEAPFESHSKCCDIMKKRPAKQYEKETGRKPLIATMTCESALRKLRWLQVGCNAFESKRPTSQPMSFWTEQDILQYIKSYNVPYASIYGDIVPTDNKEELKTTGVDRTGCIFCMFSCQSEKEPNRFQRLRKTHPNQYKYCIGGGEMVDGKWQPNKEGLGLGKVLDYINVKYK